MKKKIVSIFVSMLLCVTVLSVTGTEIVDENGMTSSISTTTMANRDIWDLQFSFDVEAANGAAGNTGIEFDGTYFYTARWASNLIHQYDDTANLIKEFSIPGVSGLRDLAYCPADGHFYGGAAGFTLWEMDLDSETLINTYSMPVAVRSCAYDEDEDAFWVNDWSTDITLVDRSGTILDTITNSISFYASAWDGYSADGPYLWIFSGTSTGGGCQIEQYDITTGTTTGVTHTVGTPGQSIAGGLGATPDFVSGTYTLMCLAQGDTDPDTVYCYELCTTNAPPNTPSTPTGPDEGLTGVEYSFTTVTTDPEGDDVSYMFDWGDGTFSEWIGPYPSGTSGEGFHAWDEAGDYNVMAKAKDAYGESDWSDPHIMTILGGPILDVGAITGGFFRVSVKIKNIGATAATGVQWNINLEGGAFIGKETNGTDDIPAGGEITATSKLIIGFGATTITVIAEIPESSDTREQDGFVFLFFIKVNPGG